VVDQWPGVRGAIESLRAFSTNASDLWRPLNHGSDSLSLKSFEYSSISTINFSIQWSLTVSEGISPHRKFKQSPTAENHHERKITEHHGRGSDSLILENFYCICSTNISISGGLRRSPKSSPHKLFTLKSRCRESPRKEDY